MANENIENNPVRESTESSLGKVGENVFQELFRDLAVAGAAMFGDGPRPPSERDLMAGLSFEDGCKAVQNVIDKGVGETPNLYKGAMI